jgi:hypothetical protein
MPFTKGQSGNPGGRPKALREVEEAAREYTTDALATLARICTDAAAPPAAQVSAANALLDRGWGKPKQAVEASVGMTLAELISASFSPRQTGPTAMAGSDSAGSAHEGEHSKDGNDAAYG